MHRLPFLRTAAFVLVAAAAPFAMAQWKWKDPNGVVQYSDRPPPAGTPEANILQRPAPAAPPRVAEPVAEAASAATAPTVVAARANVDPELEARRKKAEEEQAAKKKAEDQKVASARAENCRKARAQLKALDDGVRMARINDKGEREYLDDGARVAEAQRMRELVASDCR